MQIHKMRNRALLLAVVVGGIVAPNGCAFSTHAPAVPVPQPAPLVPRPNAAGIAKARVDSARYPYTTADIRFMSGMIGHHSQAIVMARWAPTHGAGPSVRVLCERIINAQQDEIFLMQTWLLDRNQALPNVNADSMSHEMPGMVHSALMPGMLTNDQLKQLDAARGRAFDRLFLTFMIQHHKGAVAMVKQLFDTDGAGQDEMVFKFASDVNVDQTTEIARMEKMLATLERN